ncbi:MAG: replicative DNA helicase [Chloroflexi bacterium]|jgi:replicative DNA helicase|nr:MAG: replicative DNA helicase [Chloroflexota bacterium]
MSNQLPPQSSDAEESILGALLIDGEVMLEIADSLKPGDFYKPANAKVYSAIQRLYEQSQPIDILTVSEELERRGQIEEIGGRAALADLCDRTPTAVHAKQYAKIVERKSMLRGLIGAAGRIASIGYEDPSDISEAIDRAESELFAVSERRAANGFTQIGTLVGAAYDQLDRMHQNRGQLMGLRTGYTAIDTITQGLQNSDFIVLAARPSVGKTSLALNIAENVSLREGKSVGVFSLEMSKEQLVLRLLSSVTKINSFNLRSGQVSGLDFSKIAEALGTLSSAKMFIDDTVNISVMELRTKARRLKMEQGLDLLIVDYLQLMQPGQQSRDGNRVQEVSDISRGLKALARELGIPIIALSQLSRQTEAREKGEPRLSDLRESGAIEQDADVVIFLYRDGERSDDAGVTGEAINFNVAKHRNGPTGSGQLWFRKEETRFVNLVRERAPELPAPGAEGDPLM